jgi:hypothetical protein
MSSVRICSVKVIFCSRVFVGWTVGRLFDWLVSWWVVWLTECRKAVSRFTIKMLV